MIRSAINGIIPKRDLVGYRYGYHPNCDLREALNFFGTTNARQSSPFSMAAPSLLAASGSGEMSSQRAITSKYTGNSCENAMYARPIATI